MGLHIDTLETLKTAPPELRKKILCCMEKGDLGTLVEICVQQDSCLQRYRDQILRLRKQVAGKSETSFLLMQQLNDITLLLQSVTFDRDCLAEELRAYRDDQE